MHCDMLKIQDGVAIVEKLSCFNNTKLLQSVPMNTATLQSILQCSLADCTHQVATGTCKLPRKLQVPIF